MTTATSTLDLRDGIHAGEDDAFAEVVRRHVGWVHGLSQRHLGDRQLAKDALASGSQSRRRNGASRLS